MISLAKVKEALEITDTDRDALITAMIPRIVAFIQTYTGRYFGEPEAYEDILTGLGIRNLWLTDIPIITAYEDIDSVDEYQYPGATVETILATDSDGFELRTKGMEAWLTRHGGYVWTQGYDYVVVYNRGYETDAGPADIEQVIIDMIALRLNLSGHEGLRSETIGGYSYTRFGEADFDALPGAQTTLDAWKRPVAV